MGALGHFTKLMLASLSCVISLCYAGPHPAVLPISESPNPKSEKAQLGKSLFYDTLFSQNKQSSCASCHDVRQGGMDSLAKYKGIDGKAGNLNTPTILNASLNFRQFWDGRAKTLQDAIDDHIANKTIFNNNWQIILERIKKNQQYVTSFHRMYEEGLNEVNVKDALSYYIKNLLTPDSAFDRYLRGDKNAMSQDALRGYLFFKKYGCITCHQGPSLGGNLSEKIGIYKDYYTAQSKVTIADLGYYNVTKKEEDKYVFKVPSLRNVAVTAPYFHDGSVKTLAEAVDLMGIYQSGQKIPAYEIPFIVKFLQSLTGRIQPELVDGESKNDK